MERGAKKVKIRELEQQIDSKTAEIAKIKSEIEALKVDLSQERTSEIPILLFCVDETAPLASRYNDYRYRHIYYCPDIDEMYNVIKLTKNDLLPNAVDLRDIFSSIDVPKSTMLGKKESENINKSIALLKKVIDDLFATNKIESWSELAEILKDINSKYRASKYVDEIMEKSKQQ